MHQVASSLGASCAQNPNWGAPEGIRTEEPRTEASKWRVAGATELVTAVTEASGSQVPRVKEQKGSRGSGWLAGPWEGQAWSWISSGGQGQQDGGGDGPTARKEAPDAHSLLRPYCALPRLYSTAWALPAASPGSRTWWAIPSFIPLWGRKAQRRGFLSRTGCEDSKQDSKARGET